MLRVLRGSRQVARRSVIDMDPHQSVLSLPGLLETVLRARQGLTEQRGSERPLPADVQAARAVLLAALERYASALEGAGRPIPYRMRDELQLSRELRLVQYY